ncbi:hypothetical protein NCAS_0A07470 [Naumovozyma castellii]|uniref:Glycosyltransferase family 91 protein n=1 Tax=Naumovozyma castellii TaxID=27288 RepID=G0V757_NAUCA|nr:hypothetical protein NCAS_0A07470 [Naumovozyma castellii CBS 4309]CCC67305.1 hypothetical protein NCAS_0A07470 [Naumovozyma castellii CBS 4309]
MSVPPEFSKKDSSSSLTSAHSDSASKVELHNNKNNILDRVTVFAKTFPRRLFQTIRRNKAYQLLALLLILLQVILVTRPDSITDTVGYYSASFSNPAVVEHKKDLLNVDVSKILRFKRWAKSPVSKNVQKQKFTSKLVTGFVNNIDITKQKLKRKNKKDHPQDSNVHEGYENLASCEDFAYTAPMEHADWSDILQDDLITARREMIKKGGLMAKEVQHESEKDWSEEKIIKEHFFRFGSSAVWLESEECFVMYTRVMYSFKGSKRDDHFSFLRGQTFDRDWNEIKGKRIPYNDMQIPNDIEQEIKLLDAALDQNQCDSLKNKDNEMFHKCQVEHTKNFLKNSKRKEEILSNYFITYPTNVNVPFDPSKNIHKGPQDPRVIVRKTNDMEDPIIVFNMYDEDEKKKRMFAFHPHRRVDPLIKLMIEGHPMRNDEKNWAPFLHEHTKESALSRGTLHFVYSLKPLEILKCSLNDGKCEVVFGADTLGLEKDNSYGEMRGGSQWIKLPDVLPTVKDKQIWVGFPKIHLSRSACRNHYYRPMLSVLVESNGVYNMDLEVPVLDFGLDVASWDMKGSYCDLLNVLNPNNIAYWDVVNQDPHTKKYEDYLAITMSESDIFSRVMVIRGVLDYILGAYKEKEIKDNFQVDEESPIILRKTLKCIADYASEQAKEYSESHPR